MRKTVLKVAAACAGLLLTAAAASAQTKITVAYTAVADFASGFYAVDAGLFRKRGLDVEFKTVPLNPQIPAALESGSMQIGGTTVPVLLQAVDGGLDHVAIAGSGITAKGDVIYAAMGRPDAAIATAKDFEGKKFGVPGIGAFLHVLFRKWLMESGADWKKVTFVEAAFPQHLDILKGGTVDGIVTGEPTVARIVTTGTGKVLTYFNDTMKGEMPVIVYSAPRAWVQKNPEAAKAFREAIAEATLFVNDPANADAVRQVIGKFIPLPPPVLSSLKFGKWKAEVTEQGLQEWIVAMQAQDMLQTKLDPTKVIAR
ncbi:ABC transporter substrate-binding protein [uncultured Alsobacter sp.]|uniref:ABC transporter substrate-binding protein n=1 Tax=uncultured Alsobacter sp. TaxID=1748258 RepID=UPI0025EED90E|nr:ABC transporter substrate-binding protein [uncultured Alsobacter sp.]